MSYFNDSMEGLFKIKGYELDSLNKKAGFTKRELGESLKKDINEYIRKSGYYLSCFSKSSFSNLMYAHYSSSSMGVCLEFDRKILNEDFEKVDLEFHWINIKYRKRVPVLDISKGISKDTILDTMMYKQKDWAYEKETRLVLPKINRVNFSPNAISRLILSERFLAKRENLLLLMRLFKSRKYKHLKESTFNVAAVGYDYKLEKFETSDLEELLKIKDLMSKFSIRHTLPK